MKVVRPGQTIGILGGGQLGRMIALEARRMGYRSLVVSDEADGPGGQVADQVMAMPNPSDRAAVLAVAAACDVMTLETEHIPVALLRALEPHVALHPGADAMATLSDRLPQRRFIERLGLAQADFMPVGSAEEVEAARRSGRFPGVLKTRQGGYDGRGQAKVENAADLAAAWQSLGQAPCVLERFVSFSAEVSVLVARGAGGETRFYPVAENRHRRHALHTTGVPANLPEALAREGERMAAAIAEGLSHAGVLAVEFFVEAGRLLVNEIAPRVHNSGHFTWGACATSQFEQHLRGICGLPLGDTTLLRPAAMLNLFGDLWQDGAPDWARVLREPAVALHLYGKRDARPGRKMGHLVVMAENAARALETAEALHRELAIRR